MDSNRSRTGVLVGLAAAAGAFGAAAMISAATAPTARADDYTDIINAVDGDYATGQADFTTALSDFSSSSFVPGLAELFYGVDDDVLGAPDNLLLGTVEALAGDPIDGSLTYDFGFPANFADGLADVEQFFNSGVNALGDAATYLSGGDYVDATYADIIGGEYFTVGLQELLLGAAASL
jgi:hypothetical protein